MHRLLVYVILMSVNVSPDSIDDGPTRMLTEMFFFKWPKPGFFLVYFCIIHMTQFKYKLIKA